MPPFDKIEPEHFLPAIERGMSLHEAEIDAITSNNDAPTFENVILAYDASGKMLSQVELIFGMLCAAENTSEMQALEEQIMPRMAAHADKIRLNGKLFERIKAVYDRRAALGLDAEQSRLLEKTYRSFVRAGALLDAERKARLKAINEELSLTAVKFGQNLLAENNNYALELASSDLDGIPATARDLAREKAEAMGRKGKYVFTLHKPSLIPFLTYSSKRELREQIYKAYLNRCNNGDEYDNKQLINDFIRLRTEKAHLLGYPSYAAYVVDDEMAGTTDAVYGLLEEIWTPALESAKGELAEMEELFRKDFPEGEFASWDWWYYAEKVRKQKYAPRRGDAAALFLAGERAGRHLLPRQPALRHHVPPDRRAAVPPRGGRLRGARRRPVASGRALFRLLPARRKEPGRVVRQLRGADLRGREARGARGVGRLQLHAPGGGNPALLTLDETETLFHEFGHALHFLFHDVKYRGLAEVEGDFVELPSQLMENWAFDPEVLKQYAVHYRSNEVIPKYLVDKLRRSELFNQGFMATELIAASLSDMDIHSITEYEPFDPMAFERKALTEKRGLIPQIEPRYRYPYFSHIFDGGYSAGYYFYTWAEVLDKDAFEAFRESGDLFNKKIAGDFRRKILARGGSEDGMTMYRDFRGKDPDKRAMLRGRGLLNEPEPSGEDAAPAAETASAAREN